MADYAESGRTQGGNPFRPYAEGTGNSGSGSSGGIYDDLKNPLEGLRGMSTGGNFTGSPLRVAGYTSDAIPLEELNAIDLGYDDDHLDTAQAAKELIKFAGYRFLSTLVACPFSMSQTLLQVQYLPAAAKYSEARDKHLRTDAEQLGDGEFQGDAPDPDDPAYYEYLRARHSGRGTQYKPAGRAHVDHQGYVVEAPEKEIGGFKPGYQLDALPDSKLTVLRRLVAHPTEGFLSMFKGSISLWVYNMLHLLLQPTLEGVLNEMLGLYDSAPMSTYVDSSAPSALTLVVSNAVVGWLLSPLELVRTRLMIQSASPIHRKYNGSVHALRTVTREEGGLATLYFSPYHLIPTLLKHTLDPVFRDMGSFFLDRVAGIDPYDHPTTFAFGGLVWKTVSALVMLPIDTIRARLQAQTRYSTKVSSTSRQLTGAKTRSEPFREFRTCVPISSVPYTGMANCAWRVITEEGETLKQMKKRRAAAMVAAMNGDAEKSRQISNVGHYGLRGLYPGITLQLAANVAIFGLSFITTEDVDDAF
ncbi:hypothetical protein H4R99_000045 [Coemansia sp. RSA 1722]|nr:hypothetical protein LPJ57_002296 [Coemansia sp. RSA 486]KAJ2238453.1 hypothetical protein IWW45_000073 [Coemansia sp. RSA 485]KAJ2606872.1 hypothetical protein H4R99_000045 [Coemansia sp. RSA 1722]